MTVLDGTVSLYLDGAFYDSQSVGTIENYAGDALRLGGYGNGETFFIGKLDDMKIYNYARTQEQILEDMNAGHPVTATGAGSAGAYWNFDEGYGTSAHDAWGDHTGTVSGASWTNDGRFGKALEYGGSDYVEIADDDTLTFGDGTSDRPFSISSWVNMDDRSSFLMFSKGSEYKLTNNNHFRLYLYDGNTSNSIYKFGGDLISYEGQWIHLVATYDGSGSVDGIRLYRNGELITDTSEGSAGTYVAMENTSNTLRIGDTTTDGLIDEPKIYPYALSEDEVRTEYNRGSAVGLAVSGPVSIGGSSSSAHAAYCPPGNAEGNCASGLDPSPVGEWKFDEKTGNEAHDTSGNGLDGTIYGGTWKSSAHCHSGACLDFPLENGNYIEVVDSTDSPLDISSSITLEAWVNPGGDGVGDPGYGRILNKNGAYKLAIYSGDDFYVSVHIGGEEKGRYIGDFGGVDPWNKWYHLALTYESGHFRTYLNGKLHEDYTSYSGSIDTNNGNLYLAASSASAYTHEGLIDHVKIYDYTRTPAQIAWDYDRGKPVAHWKMDECEGGTIHDSSGNDLHGTWSGSSGGSQTSVGNCQSSGTARGNGATGKFGSSLNFDGTDDYVDLPNDLGYTDEASVFAWFKRQGSPAGGYHVILGGQELEISVPDSTGEIRSGVYTDARYVSNHGSGLADGDWHHVGFTFDGSTKKSYIDGRYVGQQTGISGSLVSSFSNRRIGRFGSDGTYYANSLLDDIRVYNYTLSEEQIADLYNGGASLRFGE